MEIGLLLTGDELLDGAIVDTNSVWFANVLFERNLHISKKMIVRDNLLEISDAMDFLSETCNLIVVNGGLGPTSDDLTMKALSEFSGQELVENEQWVEELTNRFGGEVFNKKSTNYKQVYLPEHAEMIFNEIGTACGAVLQNSGSWFFLTPGVSVEFQHMITKHFFDFVQEKFYELSEFYNTSRLLFLHRESLVQSIVNSADLPREVAVGYRSSPPYIEIKFRSLLENKDKVDLALTKIIPLLDDFIVGDSVSNMAQTLHKSLLASGKKLSLAESFTGGMMAKLLTSNSGCSVYLQGGFLAYSNEFKKNVINVEQDVNEHNMDSLDLVCAMATNTAHKNISDYVLATTGYAETIGDSRTISFSVALVADGNCYAQKIVCDYKDRYFSRKLGAACAFNMLRLFLDGKSPLEFNSQALNFSQLEQDVREIKS